MLDTFSNLGANRSPGIFQPYNCSYKGIWKAAGRSPHGSQKSQDISNGSQQIPNESPEIPTLKARLEELKAHNETLKAELEKSSQREEDLKQMHNNYFLQVQTLINQKAIEAPGAKKKWWQFW